MVTPTVRLYPSNFVMNDSRHPKVNQLNLDTIYIIFNWFFVIDQYVRWLDISVENTNVFTSDLGFVLLIFLLFFVLVVVVFTKDWVVKTVNVEMQTVKSLNDLFKNDINNKLPFVVIFDFVENWSAGKDVLWLLKGQKSNIRLSFIWILSHFESLF